KVLEFHFTDNRDGKQFRDHRVSLTPPEVLELIRDLQQIGRLRGSGTKVPLASERDTGHITSFRRAVYLTRAMQLGDVIGEGDLVLLRPNHGVDARDQSLVQGRTVTRPVRALERLTEDLLTPP